jgi:hypothetical protein
MLPTMSSKEESTARTVPGTSDPSDSSANDDLMRRHANRQECDLQVYDCDRQSSWTAPETVEINQQPVTGLAVRDQSGPLLGHLFYGEWVRTVPSTTAFP